MAVLIKCDVTKQRQFDRSGIRQCVKVWTLVGHKCRAVWGHMLLTRALPTSTIRYTGFYEDCVLVTFSPSHQWWAGKGLNFIFISISAFNFYSTVYPIYSIFRNWGLPCSALIVLLKGTLLSYDWNGRSVRIHMTTNSSYFWHERRCSHALYHTKMWWYQVCLDIITSSNTELCMHVTSKASAIHCRSMQQQEQKLRQIVTTNGTTPVCARIPACLQLSYIVTASDTAPICNPPSLLTSPFTRMHQKLL